MAPGRGFDVLKGRSAARAGACVWLLLVAWPSWEFLAGRPGPAPVVVALGLVAVFAACWLMIMWRMLGGHSLRTRPWALAGLAAAGLALLPVFGAPWAYTSFVFAVSACGATLGTGGFAVATVVIAAVEVAALLAAGVPLARVWWVPLAIAVQAGAVFALKNMGLLIARLNAARAEVAALAVENERLRFARDLHDTLGHTLTSITIRSQLAARLAAADPVRAAGEMSEVERAARRALDEVRHAIAGYRAPSLSEELETATRNLGVAGIEVVVSPADGPIPAAAETRLAWAVREAATNVLRHSRARRCWIDLRVDGTSAALEVRDDGRPPRAARAPGDAPLAGTARPPGGVVPDAPDAGPGGRPGDGPAGSGPAGSGLAGSGLAGSGLAGLAERVAAAGGRLQAGTLPGGGYRLRVRVPLGDADRAPGEGG